MCVFSGMEWDRPGRRARFPRDWTGRRLCSTPHSSAAVARGQLRLSRLFSPAGEWVGFAELAVQMASVLRRPLGLEPDRRIMATVAVATVPPAVCKTSVRLMVILKEPDMLFRGLDIPGLFTYQKDRRNVIC
jgi:hypothetical protein